MKSNTADRWFSYWIRLQGAWESNGEMLNRCYTCGKIHSCKTLECGHYMSRRNMSTRYSEINCKPQCTYCNKWRYGAPEQFAKNLDLQYGEGTADKLKIQSKQSSKVDLQIIAKYYRELVRNHTKDLPVWF